MTKTTIYTITTEIFDISGYTEQVEVIKSYTTKIDADIALEQMYNERLKENNHNKNNITYGVYYNIYRDNTLYETTTIEETFLYT